MKKVVVLLIFCIALATMTIGAQNKPTPINLTFSTVYRQILELNKNLKTVQVGDTVLFPARNSFSEVEFWVASTASGEDTNYFCELTVKYLAGQIETLGTKKIKSEAGCSNSSLMLVVGVILFFLLMSSVHGKSFKHLRHLRH